MTISVKQIAYTACIITASIQGASGQPARGNAVAKEISALEDRIQWQSFLIEKCEQRGHEHVLESAEVRRLTECRNFLQRQHCAELLLDCLHLTPEDLLNSFEGDAPDKSLTADHSG